MWDMVPFYKSNHIFIFEYQQLETALLLSQEAHVVHVDILWLRLDLM